MADRPQETKPQNGGGTLESAARPGTERGGETIERGARGTAQGMRRGGEAGGEMVRDAGAAEMRHLGAAAGRTLERSGQTAADGERSLAHHAAEQWETTRQHLAAAMQEAARDMRALSGLSGMSHDGLQDMREGVGEFVEGMLRTNLRMVQDLFRMTSPASTIELQRRYGAEYLDTLMHGTTTMLRAARRATDAALRPLEERAAQRRSVQMSDGSHTEHARSAHECVGDVMETEVRMASPEDTVQRAAQLMREADAGVLPVGEGDRLVGMVTERDVALRLVAEGRDPRQTRVREVMTPELRYVFDDENLDNVADSMAAQQVGRLPVMNRERRLVGVISLADLARPERGGRAHRAMARETAPQSQAAE